MGWDGRRPGVTEITERTSVLKRRGCVVGVSVLFGELVGNLGDLLFFFMTCLVLPTSGVVYGAFVVRCLLFTCHCAELRLGSREDARCSGGWTVDEPCLHVRARADGWVNSHLRFLSLQGNFKRGSSHLAFGRGRWTPSAASRL
jgi:hypothetical protein